MLILVKTQRDNYQGFFIIHKALKVGVKEVDRQIVIDNTWGSLSQRKAERDRRTPRGRSNHFQRLIAHRITDWQQLIEYFKIANRESFECLLNTKMIYV